MIKLLKNDQGFTLIEIIAVLIIMSILVGAVIWKFDVFNSGATGKLAQIVIADLNEREKLEWTNLKLGAGWDDDNTFFLDMRDRGVYDLGELRWQSGPDQSDGTLMLNGNAVEFVRQWSESTKPGHWVLK